jgi:hypothetical protein
MKTAKIYVIVTQLLIQTFIVVVGSYLLTKKLTNDNDYWPGIVSVFCGLLSLVYFIIIIIKNGDKYGK